MKSHLLSKCLIVLVYALIVGPTTALALNSLPDSKLSSRYTFVSSGPLSRATHLPVAEWIPHKTVPDAMVLAVHGLTLHGESYSILARAFAAENALGSYYVAAPDLRGFGRNRISHDYCEDRDCKQKVDYVKTIEDIARLARLMRDKYPGVPLYLVGESLGATICLATAAKYPELADGMVLSGTAVNKNKLMFRDPENILAAGKALIDKKHRVKLNVFVNKLVSDDPNIVAEMQNDPLVPKALTLKELIATDKFTAKTLTFSKRIVPTTPILILQGSDDKCVVPIAVAKLASHLRTSDQTMRWLYAHSHLLLETAYIRPATIDAITSWFLDHTPEHKKNLEMMRADINVLGGKMEDERHVN
jgi:alpha-beta hydrolase superfamily lysophospholipase